MFDPEPVGGRLCVVESTHGHRVHEAVDPAEATGEVVRRTIGRRGPCSFGVRRRAYAVTAVPGVLVYQLTETASPTALRAIVECGAEGAPRHLRRRYRRPGS